MIEIINVGPHTADELGWRNYEIRIGPKVITTFRHVRVDGLAKCLLKASKAVELQQQKDASRVLLRLIEEGLQNSAKSPTTCKKKKPETRPKAG